MTTVITSVKKIIFPIALYIVTLFIGKTILQPILSQNYFTFSINYGLHLCILLYIGSLICTLSIGLWDKWEQYIFVVLPMALSAATVTAYYNIELAIYSFGIFILLVGYGAIKSTQLMNNLIKFSPSAVLRETINAYMFSCAVLAGILVFATTTNVLSFNIGKKISEVAAKPVTKLIESEIQNSLGGLVPFPEGISISTDSLDISTLIEDKVNSMVEPYHNFILPILALLIFAMIQFYATITGFIYGLTIDIIFALFKALNFYRVEIKTVEKQVLKF